MKSPVLRYVGSKWRIADEIVSRFPAHKTFVDVFCGSCSILFNKALSKNEIINDKDSDVFNFFQVLRDQGSQLKSLLEGTPYSRREYEYCRQECEDSLERARRTMVRSWFGIGDSLHKKTGFKVSISQNGSVTNPWCNCVDFLHLYQQRLRGVIIESLDFVDIIKKYDKEDTLFYFDPPYVLGARSGNRYYKHDFSDTDHQIFLSLLPDIRGRFVLSGYESGLYSGLPYRKEVISGFSETNNRLECIWIK